VRAGNMAHCVDHDSDDKPEDHWHGHGSDLAGHSFRHHDGAAAGEHECERSDELGDRLACKVAPWRRSVASLDAVLGSFMTLTSRRSRMECKRKTRRCIRLRTSDSITPCRHVQPSFARG
jgi:hypothetical protein